MFNDTCRAVRTDEAAILRWMLVNASLVGPLHGLAGVVSSLYVQDRCRCGCCSVTFVNDRPGSRCEPIAEASGRTADGRPMDVRVWGTSEAVTALEIIGETSSEDRLPLIETLCPSMAFPIGTSHSFSRRWA